MFCFKFSLFAFALLLAGSLSAQAQTAVFASNAPAYNTGYSNQDYPSSYNERLPSSPKGIVHQADELCERIGLPQGENREEITRYMYSLVMTDSPDQPLVTLSQLLRTHTRDFQRLLAPMLPQPNYDRYVALLDGLGIQAN